LEFSTVSAVPIYLFSCLLAPIRWFLHKAVVDPFVRLISPRYYSASGKQRTGRITTHEVHGLLDLAVKEGTLHPVEEATLEQIVDLAQIKVEEVMTPRVDMMTFPADETPQNLYSLMRERKTTCIALDEGDPDHLLGWVTLRDIAVHPEQSLRELAQPILYVPEIQTLDMLLQQLRENDQKMAVAVDEYGGTAGVVMLDEVRRRLLGELRGLMEHNFPLVEQVGDNEYIVSGDLSIREGFIPVQEELADKVVSMGGLISALLGRAPREGDEVEHEGVVCRVEEVFRNRVRRIRIILKENGKNHSD
jgi:CBS domain containing-hemolysin-like protein